MSTAIERLRQRIAKSRKQQTNLKFWQTVRIIVDANDVDEVITELERFRAAPPIPQGWSIVNGWIVEDGDPEPEPLFHLDWLPGYDRLIDVLAAPQWSSTVRSHDDEFEYTISSNCDGSEVTTFRRRPARSVPPSEWQEVKP